MRTPAPVWSVYIAQPQTGAVAAVIASRSGSSSIPSLDLGPIGSSMFQTDGIDAAQNCISHGWRTGRHSPPDPRWSRLGWGGMLPAFAPSDQVENSAAAFRPSV